MLDSIENSVDQFSSIFPASRIPVEEPENILQAENISSRPMFHDAPLSPGTQSQISREGGSPGGFHGYVMNDNGSKNFFQNSKSEKSEEEKMEQREEREELREELEDFHARDTISNPVLVPSDTLSVANDNVYDLDEDLYDLRRAPTRYESPVNDSGSDLVHFDASDISDLAYMDVEYETETHPLIFNRFLGVDIVRTINGVDHIQKGFPMPVKPGRPLQRQNLPPKQVMEHYSGFDSEFQKEILDAKGIPTMNGSFLVVFTYEDTVGRLRLNLNSLTQSEGPAEGVETFNGWGNEVVNGHDFYFSIKNGEVKEGWWRMDILFASGNQFTYWGNVRKGWYLEGCFTQLGGPFDEPSCWGKGFMFPNQLSTEEATNFLLSISTLYYTDELEVENKDKYLRKRANFEKLISAAGSTVNLRDEDRASKFNSGPSHLFYNDFFSIDKFYWGALDFITERFSATDKQVQNHKVRTKRKFWHLCQFSPVPCPKKMQKITIKQLKNQLV